MTSSRTAPIEYRPSYAAAGGAALLVFVLYLVTLSPSTALWDTSEYMAAAKVLGLPHPPGNPLFVMLGHVFGLLPIPVSWAQRINIMAALASAVSAGIWFLITERVLARWLEQRWQRLAGAGVAALVGATSFTVWNQSVVNEKVYTISLVGIAVISWLMVQWSDSPEGRRADRTLILVAFLLGLGYTNHPAGFLPLPAVGVAVLVRRPAVLLRWRLLLACAGAVMLGLTPFAFEPVRAAYFPPINEGEPTACLTQFGWGCTFSHLTYERLMDNIERKQYAKPSVLDRQAPFTAQVGMWWLYFKWQWLRDAYHQQPVLQNILAALFLVLGLFGAWTHWTRDRTSFWYFATLLFTLTIALIFYLNFKYGWSQAPELGNSVAREVRDRDYFYLWSFSAWSVWAALGMVSLWESLAALTSGTREAVAASIPRRGWLAGSPVLALAIIPLITNAGQAPRSGQTFTRDWAVDLLNSVEPNAILITMGDNDTFPLWYAQQVEGVRRDVLVAVTTYLQTDWFVRQFIRNPPLPYDPAAGPSLYRNTKWPVPSGPPLALTFEQADEIPPLVQLREPQVFTAGAITATIPAGILTRDQIIVLRMIRDGYPGRPVYFSSSEYPRAMGLGPYLVTQGLATKLVPQAVTASPDTVRAPGGYFEIQRSLALWDSVYAGPRSLIAQNGWVDRASAGIPLHYVIVGSILSEALAARGDTARAEAVARTVEEMTHSARLESILGGG